MGQTYSRRKKSMPNLYNPTLDENKTNASLENLTSDSKVLSKHKKNQQQEAQSALKSNSNHRPNDIIYNNNNNTSFNTLRFNLNPPRMVLQPKTNQIYDDYVISRTVLGLGISGKVLCCTSKTTQKRYALKVSKKKFKKKKIRSIRSLIY